MVSLPWTEDGGGEIGVIGTVWIVLGFETEGGASWVSVAFFAGDVFEVVGSVELDGGLGSAHFKDTAR